MNKEEMMKYICTNSEDGIEEIFTFPRYVDHDCMAEALRRIKNQSHGNWKRIHRDPISAGFVHDTGECFGKSITLGLKSRKELDTKILKDQIY